MVSVLYHEAKSRKIPMTKLADTLLRIVSVKFQQKEWVIEERRGC